jgi:hypothetical protein
VSATFLQGAATTMSTPTSDSLAEGPRSLIDVLDRVLDTGVTVEPWVRASLASLDLAGGEARVSVASVEVYLAYAMPSDADDLATHPAEPAPATEPADVMAAREHEELKRALERLDA